MPRDEKENKNRTERDIDVGKGGSWAVIVGWEVTVKTDYVKYK